MSYFAHLDENNIVIAVTAASDNDDGNEEVMSISSGLTLRQTSYNTCGGVHLLGGTPFRKNYAGIGYTYDATRDAFIPQQPYASWILNEDTCLWESPAPYPTDGKQYTWDEGTTSWMVWTV